MESNPNYLEDLRLIKKVMEESSRFISLSGISGIFAGLIALAGAAAAFAILNGNFQLTGPLNELSANHASMLLADAAIVLLLALGASVLFSWRKSVRHQLRIWTPVSRKFLINLAVPLITGGLFIIILIQRGNAEYVVPSMLLFYGLALVNSGKFTFSEVFYLGLIEIVAGLLASVFTDLWIWFWCFGFGLMHIVYGLLVFRKYK
jgi:hypothetical protein